MGKRKWQPVSREGARSNDAQDTSASDEPHGETRQGRGASSSATTPQGAAIPGRHSQETQQNTAYVEGTVLRPGVKRAHTGVDPRRGIWEESAPTRAARWRRYPKLAAVTGAWAAARQDPERRRQETMRAVTQHAERYPAAQKEKARWTDERRIAERLPWPHTWKRRKRAADEQDRDRRRDGAAQREAEKEAAKAPRSATRSHLRRGRAGAARRI